MQKGGRRSLSLSTVVSLSKSDLCILWYLITTYFNFNPSIYRKLLRVSCQKRNLSSLYVIVYETSKYGLSSLKNGMCTITIIHRFYCDLQFHDSEKNNRHKKSSKRRGEDKHPRILH